MKHGSSAIVIIVVIFVIAIGGSILYFMQSSPSNSEDISLPTSVYQASSTNTKDDEMDDKTSDTKSQTNNYIAYSPEALDEGVNKTRVLFFYANWCPTCIPVDKELQGNETEIPDGTIVYRVNYNDNATDDNEKALANKYNVTYQHTFVIIDDQGNEIAKWNGGGLDKLLANLK